MVDGGDGGRGVMSEEVGRRLKIDASCLWRDDGNAKAASGMIEVVGRHEK